MTGNVDDARLMAYLDGELSDAEALAVEQALASSPELREREAELRQLLGDLVFDFAQLDALDAKALTRIAEANALPARRESYDGIPSRGSLNGSSGSPEPLTFAAQSWNGHTKRVSRPWTRTIGWLAAAGLLIAVGAGGAWWLARGGLSGNDALVATHEGANRDLRNEVGESGRQSPDGRVATRAGQRGEAAAGSQRSPSSTSSPTQSPESRIDETRVTAAAPSVGIRLAGADPVGGQQTQQNEAGGVRNFVIDGVRIAVAYGAEVPDSLSVLDGSELTRLRDRASATNAGTGGGRALNDRTVAPRDSLCPAGLRFIDRASGLPLSIRGPASCALLARLALQVQVQPGP